MFIKVLDSKNSLYHRIKSWRNKWADSNLHHLNTRNPGFLKIQKKNMHNPAGSTVNPAAQKSKEEFISINREPQTNADSSENNYSPGPSKAKGGQRGYGRGGGSVVYGAPKATPTRSYNSVAASSSRCLIQSVLITHFKIVCLFVVLFDLGFGQYCKISVGQLSRTFKYC